MKERSPRHLLLLSLVALAAVIYVTATLPAERSLSHQRRRKHELEQRIESERRQGLYLRQLREALVHDPQTVERELRRSGFGRAGDVRLAAPRER